MSNIVVHKVRETEALPGPLADEIESLSARIRQRAYDLFAMRGGSDGHELDDWLQAEREMMWQPGTELSERESEFQARIYIPNLDPRDVRVIALPRTILLVAEPSQRGEPKRISRINLWASIDPDRVTARAENGLLEITAAKMRQQALAA